MLSQKELCIKQNTWNKSYPTLTLVALKVRSTTVYLYNVQSQGLKNSAMQNVCCILPHLFRSMRNPSGLKIIQNCSFRFQSEIESS